MIILKINKQLKMKNKKIKSFTLDEMKAKYVGELGTESRTRYEAELNMEIIGELIRKTRLERQLTQEALGKLVGVQKAQISKLENHANSARIDTIIRVFKALHAEISFSITFENKVVQFV
jgi:DNA-binding XRE family transcriptional regulator